MSLAKDSLPRTSLSFPGKVSIKKSGDKLAISDTGHHQILIVDMNGAVETTVGSGVAGLEDGGFQQAQFNSPQGVTWKGDSMLFVADTENHAIRMVIFLYGALMSTLGSDMILYKILKMILRDPLGSNFCCFV